jgi:hypothetical protein
VNTLIIGA